MRGCLIDGDAVAAGARFDAEVAGAVTCFEVGVATDAATVGDVAERVSTRGICALKVSL